MKNIGTALLINGVFSLLTGITLILFPQTIADIFGASIVYPFWLLGIGLLVFSLVVLYESCRQENKFVNVFIIIVLDVVWVLGSIAVIGFELWHLNAVGYRTIGIVAGIVLFFAVHQSYALVFSDKN